MSKFCSHGTLLHLSLQNSNLIVCYYHQDLRFKLLKFASQHNMYHNENALLHKDTENKHRLLQIGNPLKCHPFSGQVNSAGELLHTP